MTKSNECNADPQVQKPKRPLSAYNFFFSRERQKIIATNMAKSGASKEEIVKMLALKVKDMPHRKSHGTISFRTLAKTIADTWKAMSESEKQPFKELARAETMRYRKEVEQWKVHQQNLVNGNTTVMTNKLKTTQLEKESKPSKVFSGAESQNFITPPVTLPPNELDTDFFSVGTETSSYRTHDDFGMKIPDLQAFSRGDLSTFMEPLMDTVTLTQTLQRNNGMSLAKVIADRLKTLRAGKDKKPSEVISGSDDIRTNSTTTQRSDLRNDSSLGGTQKSAHRTNDDFGMKIPALQAFSRDDLSTSKSANETSPKTRDINTPLYRSNRNSPPPNLERYLHRVDELAQNLDDDCIGLLSGWS